MANPYYDAALNRVAKRIGIEVVIKNGILTIEKKPALQDITLVVEKSPQRKNYRGTGGIKLPGDDRQISIGEKVVVFDRDHYGLPGIVTNSEGGNWVFNYSVELQGGERIRVKHNQIEPEVNP